MAEDGQTPTSEQIAAEGDEQPSFDEAGRALFALIRLLGRPIAGHTPASAAGRALELSRIMVVQAVEAARDEGGPDAEIGVGTVAARLAIDPSTASRLVADTIADGFLIGAPSPTDARRRRLTLTESGSALAADARRFQGDTFAAATADWPEDVRRDFARRFVQFAAAIAALREAAGTSSQ